MVPRATAQLDLFTTGDTSAAHELAIALAAHDRPTAERALGELEHRDPGHPLVAVAPALLAGIGWQPGADAAAWQRMAELGELARRGLGERADDFLRPLWELLAEAAERAEAPYQHPSAAWYQAGDGSRVMQSLGNAPDRLASPELVARGVRALAAMDLHREALAWYFDLCWRFPELGEIVEQLADDTLHLDAALDAWYDAELPDKLGWHLFPEWLTLGRWVPVDSALAPTRRPPSYEAACRVVQEPTELEARRQLQAVAPALLRAFMAQR